MTTAKKQQPEKLQFEQEYEEIMKGYQGDFYFNSNVQWTTPNDYFVKFSLYPERSSGTTSTDTCLINPNNII